MELSLTQQKMKRYYEENSILCGNCNGEGLQGHMDYCRACRGTGIEPLNDYLRRFKDKFFATMRYNKYKELWSLKD